MIPFQEWLFFRFFLPNLSFPSKTFFGSFALALNLDFISEPTKWACHCSFPSFRTRHSWKVLLDVWDFSPPCHCDPSLTRFFFILSIGCSPLFFLNLLVLFCFLYLRVLLVSLFSLGVYPLLIGHVGPFSLHHSLDFPNSRCLLP